MTYKPDGYPDVSAYLLVADAEATLAFGEAAFGAERLRVIREGGGIMHAEMRIGDSIVMMGEVPDGSPTNLHLYMADPDAAFARARDLGAAEVQPMQEKGDGDRRGGVRDPQGTVWWLSKQVEGT